MANAETQKLIIESIDYYIANGLTPQDKCPDMETMRKIVKLDDIKQGLEKKSDAE